MFRDQSPLFALVQCCVVAVVNAAAPRAFIEFPPQSPVYPAAADISQEAAPAPVMSLKSTLSIVTAAAVIVRAVPTIVELTSTLFILEFPVIVSVHVTVVFALNVATSVLVAVPSSVRFANVNAHVISVHGEVIDTV